MKYINTIFHQLLNSIPRRQLEARFVTRMKSNAEFKVLKTIETTEVGVLEDALIKLSYSSAHKRCVASALSGRMMVKNWSSLPMTPNVRLERLRISTNSAGRLSSFLKWIKQNLKIKRFFETGENADKTQIIIAYLLLQMDRLVAVNILHRCSIFALLIHLPLPEKTKTLDDQRQLELINAEPDSSEVV